MSCKYGIPRLNSLAGYVQHGRIFITNLLKNDMKIRTGAVIILKLLVSRGAIYKWKNNLYCSRGTYG